MNILFLSLYGFESLEESNIYTDLLRQFSKKGHNIYIISPLERRKKGVTHILKEKNTEILRLRTGNITQNNIIEKGLTTIMIESLFIRAIKKYFGHVKFDLVMYTTPPVTFAKVVQYIKKRDGARSYLLLKDIFPQNAVDLGMLEKRGLKGIAYRYFRRKEKYLYKVSDKIGCMSRANAEYVLKHNPTIDKKRVEICPNCIEIKDVLVSKEERSRLRKKWGIPEDKKVFVYGGNFGKPQGIPFIIQCLKAQRHNPDVFFLIVGDGTEFNKLAEFFRKEKPQNAKLLKRLPKEEYDNVIASCDIGMIFLDYRFTIPNFPSRLLGYMQAGLPVLACTDVNTDLGEVITDNGFGWWCKNGDLEEFNQTIDDIIRNANLSEMSRRSLEYLDEYYNAAKVYSMILTA